MHWYSGNNKSARKIPVRYVDHRGATASPPRQEEPTEWVREVRRSPYENHVSGPSNQKSGSVSQVQKVVEPAREKTETRSEGEVDWRALALRLRADMDNFRQRQMRRADEAIAAERERLLRQFLPVADNLRRALNYEQQDEATLREGVELVYRQLARMLELEGVTPIEAVNQPFDPELHEAIATTPAQTEAGLVVEEIEPGYKMNDKLLRPAQVIVAG
jgi:molecular chaperone GrpE